MHCGAGHFSSTQHNGGSKKKKSYGNFCFFRGDVCSCDVSVVPLAPRNTPTRAPQQKARQTRFVRPCRASLMQQLSISSSLSFFKGTPRRRSGPHTPPHPRLRILPLLPFSAPRAARRRELSEARTTAPSRARAELGFARRDRPRLAPRDPSQPRARRVGSGRRGGRIESSSSSSLGRVRRGVGSPGPQRMRGPGGAGDPLRAAAARSAFRFPPASASSRFSAWVFSPSAGTGEIGGVPELVGGFLRRGNGSLVLLLLPPACVIRRGLVLGWCGLRKRKDGMLLFV